MNPLDAVARYGSQAQAADNLGIGRTKFREVYKLALAQRGANCHPVIPPNNSAGNSAGNSAAELASRNCGIKPRVSIRADMPSTRVLCIGDVHDKPGLDKSRLKWIARHAQATKPDKIVQIGDFGDFASCSAHEPAGSIGFALKPSFRQDMESLEEALTVFHKEIGPDIEMLLCEGNHEHRVFRFEQLHPAVEDGFYKQLQDMWARFAWKPVAFGEWHFIDSVGFSHIPLNILGKPYGGKNVSNAIGNDSTFSVVHGHDHRSGFKCVPKIGPAQSIEILDLGTALPDKYVASYAKVSTTGWTYGIFDIEIRCGHITNHSFIDMAELERRYGD
jgi:hypothetical protein